MFKGFFFLFLFFALTNTFAAPKYSLQYGESDTANWKPLSRNAALDWKKDYWVRITIDSIDGGSYVLQSGNWYMQSTEFYNQQNERLGIGNTLLLSNVSNGSIFYAYYPFIDQKNDRKISLTITPQAEFLERLRSKNSFQAIFLSIYIFVAFISIIFALRSKDRVYLHYSLYILSIVWFFAYQYGILGTLIPFVTKIPPAWMWIFSASITITYLFFAQSFLDLKKQDRFNFNIFRLGQYIVLIVVVIESLSYLLHYDIQHQIGYKICLLLIQAPLMVLIIYRIYLMKGVLSNIFLFGLVILIISTLTGQALSTYKMTYEANRIIQVGLLLDICVFSVGIGVRIGLIYRAREEVQSELIEQLQLNKKMQTKYMDELEVTVKRRTAQLQKQNMQNELLLGEIHHRVKNNLQMVSSLLSLQEKNLDDNMAKRAIKEGKERIKSMELIHKMLYQNDNFTGIEMKVYIKSLVTELLESFGKQDAVNLDIAFQSIRLDVDTAIPIGLLINELTINALKYAYQNIENPALTIDLRENEDRLILTVQDNGTGKVDDVVNSKSFGMKLVNSLTRQLNGSLNIDVRNGLCFVMVFNDYKVV